MNTHFLRGALGLALWLGTSPAASAQDTAADAPVSPSWNVLGTFGAWEVRCPKAEAGSGRCSAVLEVMESESRRVLLAWTYALDPGGSTVGMFYTPTGIRIQPGVEVQIDGKTPVFRVPFIGCRTEGCTAEGIMTPELLALVRSGEKARVTIMTLQGRAFNFEIPIAGLAGALDSLPRS